MGWGVMTPLQGGRDPFSKGIADCDCQGTVFLPDLPAFLFWGLGFSVWGVGCVVWWAVWCVVCGVWCVVCGVWCVVCGVW